MPATSGTGAFCFFPYIKKPSPTDPNTTPQRSNAVPPILQSVVLILRRNMRDGLRVARLHQDEVKSGGTGASHLAVGTCDSRVFAAVSQRKFAVPRCRIEVRFDITALSARKRGRWSFADLDNCSTSLVVPVWVDLKFNECSGVCRALIAKSCCRAVATVRLRHTYCALIATSVRCRNRLGTGARLAL